MIYNQTMNEGTNGMYGNGAQQLMDGAQNPNVQQPVKSPSVVPPVPATMTPGSPTPSPSPVPSPSPTPQAPSAPPAAGAVAPMTPPSQSSVSPTISSLGALPPTQSFGPGSDLLGTQINPSTDPRLAGTQAQVGTAANKLTSGPDRFGIAQDRFNTFAQQTDPYFQRSLRDATGAAAGAGQLGSGQLRSSLGDVANSRDLQLQGEQQNVFQDALQGTIGDNQTNVGLLSGLEGQQYGENAANADALRAERGYQSGVENQGYNRGVQGLTLQDALTNSAFGRALQQNNAGNQNNPAQMQMLLSGLYGDQASQAGSSLNSLVSGNAQNSILNSIYGGMGSQNGINPNPNTVRP